MIFKQLQVFQLNTTFDCSRKNIEACLNKFAFRPCLPSLPFSAGWVSVLDEEDSPFIRSISNCIIFCVQFEEKILPESVVRKVLLDKIKEIEKTENRKVRQKEKWSLKDEIVMTLLPRAFSKFTKVYAYIDVTQRWLILCTTNEKKTEQFLTLFKKSMGDELKSFDLKKISSILTNWIKEKNYPDSFNVEKECVLQDPNQSNRVIRCKQQNLFSESIKGLIKDGCAVKQLGLSWQDQLHFVLHDDFSMHGIQMHDEILEQVKSMEPETKQQQFDANFIIIEALFSALIKKLLSLFTEKKSIGSINKKMVLV